MTAVATISGHVGSRARAISFARPLIGFPDDERFVLQALEPRYAPYLALSAVRPGGPRFVVVAPGRIFPDYVIEIPEQDVELLGLADEGVVEVLCLVTRRSDGVPTVNLLGPLVVNQATSVAAQVVLADSGYQAAVPVDAARARQA